MKANIVWLPFQLNPGIPDEGMPRAEYRKAKFGSVERGRQLDARVSTEGAGEDIAFAFDRIERTPNTRAAHQLIELAQSQEMTRPRDSAWSMPSSTRTSRKERTSVMQTCSPVSPAANGVSGWPGQANATSVAEKEEGVRSLGISAVPTFIIARKFGVSGAHPPEALADAIRQALT